MPKSLQNGLDFGVVHASILFVFPTLLPDLRGVTLCEIA
jgi:hypothetical protein